MFKILFRNNINNVFATFSKFVNSLFRMKNRKFQNVKINSNIINKLLNILFFIQINKFSFNFKYK